jgi:hypothetical protein
MDSNSEIMIWRNEIIVRSEILADIDKINIFMEDDAYLCMFTSKLYCKFTSNLYNNLLWDLYEFSVFSWTNNDFLKFFTYGYSLLITQFPSFNLKLNLS